MPREYIHLSKDNFTCCFVRLISDIMRSFFWLTPCAHLKVKTVPFRSCLISVICWGFFLKKICNITDEEKVDETKNPNLNAFDYSFHCQWLRLRKDPSPLRAVATSGRVFLAFHSESPFLHLSFFRIFSLFSPYFLLI